MENKLLKGSNFQKRSDLQAVRSYLGADNRSVVVNLQSQPSTILDSPPKTGRTLKGFGTRFRDLLHHSNKDVAPALAKRKVGCRDFSLHLNKPPPNSQINIATETEVSTKRIRQSPGILHHSENHSRKDTLSVSNHLVTVAKESEVSVVSVGFNNLAWRERMTSTVPSGGSSQILPISIETELFPPFKESESTSGGVTVNPEVICREMQHVLAADMEQIPEMKTKLSRQKKHSHEVSSNFVKKDLSRRGSYKFKNSAKIRQNTRFRHGVNTGRDEITPSLNSSNSEETFPERVKSSGLSVLGLDPIHLYQETASLTDDDSQIDIPAPLCTGHQMAAKLLTVKKSGMNKVRTIFKSYFNSSKGRKFYSCAFPFDQRCGFFLWEDDNPNIFLHSSNQHKRLDGAKISYFQSILLLYRKRLKEFDLFELKNEVSRLNYFLKEHNQGRISSCGKKNDLIDTLINCVGEVLDNCEKGCSSGNSFISCDTKTILTPTFDDPDNSNDSDGSIISLSDVEVAALHSTKATGTSTDDMISQALRRTFRLSELKHGQEWAINRVLTHQSSLLVLPTGAGKSLTFLLPSLLMCPRDGITIVISPLLSLMRDQIRKLPFNLPAACLSGDVTAAEAAAICSDMKSGFLRILFISPERFSLPSFQRLVNQLNCANRSHTATLSSDISTERTAPGVGLLCIDEVHCLSQWSFNFRPSFLRIRSQIEKIRPKSILALTATAPPHVQRDIQTALGIPPEGICIQSPNRPNLRLKARYVQGEEEKRKIILESLQQCISSKNRVFPTIIYVWRRDETESLSEYLQMQGYPTRPYHAGMSSSQRIKVQYLFHRGIVDIVVATVAFGMGIDKPDVRLVIHHSMPKDIESYLQEIGRAGRDGLTSNCLLLLSPDDYIKHSSLTYSASISTIQLVLLLRRIFLARSNEVLLPEEQIPLDLEDLSSQIDVSVSLIETIVCYLERDPYSCLMLTESRLDKVTGKFKSKCSDEDPVIKAIVEINQSPSNQVDFQFSLLSLSIYLRMSPDEAASLLYRSQGRGILLYQLSKKSLYLTIRRPFQSPLQVGSWIQEIAVSLGNFLNSQLYAAGNRVSNVWSFGKLISSETVDETERFARQYLETYITEGNSSLDCCAPSPLIDQPTLRYYDPCEIEELNKCKRQINILFNDPAVNDLVSGILQSEVDVGEGLKSQVVAKILHGIQTVRIKSADWEHRAQWSSCRMISYPTLLSLCCSRHNIEEDL